jgi:hypothetical protein
MDFQYGPNFGFGVNKQLMDILKEAAKQSQYDVIFNSGKNPRSTGTKWHPSGRGVDISLKDPESGKILPNLRNDKTFRQYEQFAQTAHQLAQERNYPLRWGGYFRKRDEMHFDGGGNEVPMGGGSWRGGLTQAQRERYPNVISAGTGVQPMSTASTGVAARPPQAQPPGAGLNSPQVPGQPQGIEDQLKKIFGAELEGVGGGKGNLLSRIGGALNKLGGDQQQIAQAPDLPSPPSTTPPQPVPVPMPYGEPAGGDAQGTQDLSQTSPLAAMVASLTPEQLDMYKKMGLL